MTAAARTQPINVSASNNIVALFEATATRLATRTAAKSKRSGRWEDVSWAELARRARLLADGFAALGVRPGDRVAILGDTQLEWVLTYLGILGAGAIGVPIYQSNKSPECRFIIENSGATWVAADSETQVAKIHEIRGQTPTVRGLIRMVGPARDKWERSLDDLEKLGAEYRRAHPEAHTARIAAIRPDDLACLLYTSGTTGSPKGVMLSHANWVYEAEGVLSVDIITPADTILMFLPLAHSFSQVVVIAWIGAGAIAAFAESIERLVDNAGEVRPTIVAAVPRIFEKAFANVVQRGLATGGVKGKLFRMAMAAFDRYATTREEGGSYSSLRLGLGKRLVFPKVGAALNERFGGHMRLFVSGGAPLSPKIAYFFDLLGIVILEGYGLTETSAATCVNRPGQNKIGTVGPAIPGTDLKVVEDGEILVRGGGVMRGYWNDPAATAEVLKEGWFATGDIGYLDAEGYLKITDRKKDIIVTASGKNVAPQNLENDLKTHDMISQVMVHGDRRKFLSALVTINEENARKWAVANGMASLSIAELAAHPKMIERVQQAVDAVNAKQASYATIKKFAILPRDFAIETGELTPTLKVKRKFTSQKYKDILDAFYRE